MKVRLFAVTIVLTAFFSNNSIAQSYSRGGVPKDFLNDENHVLLCVYGNAYEYDEMNDNLIDFFHGTYLLVSLEDFKKNEDYKNKEKFRYMLCKDVGDVYGENDGKYQGATTFWCVLDREEHIRNLHLSYENNQVEILMKKLDRARDKGAK